MVLQQQDLSVVEAAHAGRAVLGGGDDLQKGVIGAVLIGNNIFWAVVNPGPQEPLCVIAQCAQMCAGQIIFAAANQSPELSAGNAAGGYAEL